MPSKRSRKGPPRSRPTRPGQTAYWAAPSGPEEISSSGFTMRDEARNTASHPPNWNKGAKLRENPVAFVSAGFGRPLDDLDNLEAQLPQPDPPELAKERISNSGTETGTREPNVSTTSPDEPCVPPSMPFVSREDVIARSAEPTPAVDIALLGRDGEGMETTSQPAPSSVFFFDLGRDRTQNMPRQLPPPVTGTLSPDDSPSDSGEDVLLFKGRSWRAAQKAQFQTLKVQHILSKPASTSPRGSEISVPAMPYVENAQQDPALGTGGAGLQSPHPASLTSDKTILCEMETQLSGEMRDVAMDDEIITVASVSRRPAENDMSAGHGVSYSDDAFAADPLVSALSFPGRQGVAGTLTQGGETVDEGAEETDDGSESPGGDDMDADFNDEALAQLLSRRDELDVGRDSHIFVSDFPSETKDRTRLRARNQGITKSTSRLINNQPAGPQAVVQALDELSLSDFGQTSLVGLPNMRTKRAPPSFNVSDSELEQNLQAAWLNDRQRKKNRKKQREEMRQQGLLGKHANPDELRIKYRDGMRLDEIKLELKLFLLGTHESIQFPPLDKHARKIVHELASKFKVKSQSTGSGDQRRPILYRTKATVRYAENRGDEIMRHIDEASSRIHRKYFPRAGNESSGLKKVNSGRSSHAAATFREGEVVGASVPEIGQGNKGRAMLEKMGWTRGMGLGTDDNKGILEPVAQVVKRSKAGLG